MKHRVLVDTGPLVAFLNQRDRHHQWAVDQLGDIQPPLLTCESVLSEACFLLRAHAHGTSAVMQLRRRGLVASPFSIQAEVERIATLMSKYADVPMSLADAALVCMAEQGVGTTVITLDDDFRIYRMRGRQLIPTIAPAA